MQYRGILKWVRACSLVVLAMIAIAAIAPAAHAQNTVGTITQLAGTANIQRAGATIAVAPNMPVMLHDRIATDANASLTIGLVDNSSLQLGSSSTLVIDESVLVNGVGAPSKVGLLNGDLHSLIVGAMKGSSTTFEVNTPNAIGAVRGTDFQMHTDTNGRQGYPDCFQFTDLSVNDGTVQFCNTATPPECKDIKGGQHSTMACGGFAGASGAGLGGVVGATALGVGLAAGAGVGIAAGAGAFGGSSSPSK
ncbi:MAG: FecR family protein [Candidatus Binatus sp.]|uniref:FecR family protein n=1 Tax=Candidatus Binatus sp. TaxID=2811406 RepID=UPI003BB0215C